MKHDMKSIARKAERIARERAGGSVNRRDAIDLALVFAGAAGDIKVAEILLAAGADVHFWSAEALKEAAENGHIEVVQLLLELGADPDMGSGSGNAWQRAAKNGHREVAKLLLSWQSDAEGQSPRGPRGQEPQ